MAEVPQTETRKLAAIMFTDIVDFSRQMGSDEARMLRLLEVHNQLIQQAVTTHHGMVIKTVGDAFLVDFPSVVNAVQCAQAIQTQFKAHNTERAPAEQIHVRIGIHPITFPFWEIHTACCTNMTKRSIRSRNPSVYARIPALRSAWLLPITSQGVTRWRR